jgi:hypothetical protein
MSVSLATKVGTRAVARTWEISAGDSRDWKSLQAGVKRLWKASSNTGGDGLEVRTGWLKRTSASWLLGTEGFSSKTCFPFARALMAHSKCSPPGRGM